MKPGAVASLHCEQTNGNVFAKGQETCKLSNSTLQTKKRSYFNHYLHKSILFANRKWIHAIHKIRLGEHRKRIQSLIFIFLIGMASGFPSLCAEPEPIDLLAHAISEAKNLPHGVEVVPDKDNIKGYRFDSSARLLGVDSETVFPLCNRFPAEFSIILTFQHHSRRSTNEFFMTLLAPDRHTALIALRLQRDRISLDYVSKFSSTKHSPSIKDPVFSDGKWHTVVVSVTPTQVKFTLDCGTPQKRTLKAPFPKKLNIKRTRIYVASRRKKRKRFTGLLRQLVLLPGADAAVRICPSRNPALATLNQESSVPASPGFTVLFEKESTDLVCSSNNRGTLMYSEEGEILKICDANSFQAIGRGHERMDYVIDYDDIITDNYTVSMEPFSIPGEGKFIATANNDDIKSNFSHIFRWDGEKFTKYQNVKTSCATMWKYFNIGTEHFLAVANTGREGETGVSSAIYRWSSRTKRFLLFQSLENVKTRSIEAFSIEGSFEMMYFIAVANQRYSGQNEEGRNVKSSVILKWNRDLRRFDFYQQLPSVVAVDLTFFQISLSPQLTFSCLIIANTYNGETSHVNSEIYCWDFRTYLFQPRQQIETVGAVDWEFFQFQDRYFLAVANSFDKRPNQNSTRTLNSSIYELNLQLEEFLLYQDIETHGANDWEFFTIGTQYFLIVSNTESSVSEVYRWKGVEKFVKVHSLPVGRCSDFDYLPIHGQHYLASANPVGEMSKLYKIMTY